ncbi:MAG: NADH-quinone oxidoreductase subunit C [Elusimicrobia bacterium]|nr:NADH-quinone oxidoreductase subunit C [Elusimicrobiota bacterium]
MTAEEILTRLQASFPGLVKSETQVKEYPTWTVPAQSVRAVCERLRSEFSFDYLDVVTATDWSGPVSPKGYPQSPPAAREAAGAAAAGGAGRDVFEMVYLVSALSIGMKLCLRFEISRKEGASVPSLYGIFMAADWQEREVYDLFGIHFKGHPNLKRILTPEIQVGHPLRKDYEHVPDSYD